MAFETFPIPSKGVDVDAVNARLADQHAQLIGVVTHLSGGLDNALRSQQGTLAKVAGKLTRAVNGRLKQQGTTLAVPVASLSAAMGSAIAQQGEQLTIQSLLLPRLAPPAGAGVGPSAGVPGGAISSAPQPIRQPSPGAGNVFQYAVLCDCNTRRIDIYNMEDERILQAVANGAFVPIRYSHNPHTTQIPPYGDYGPTELTDGFLGAPGYLGGAWADIACHAREHNGEGWPPNGDFPHTPNPDYPYDGLPVGDWPFDANGKYIGL